MARKKKRRTKSTKASISTEAKPEVILRKAEDLLASGKVSRAREGFRRLFKLEPEVYRQRYIEVTRAAIEFAVSEGKTGQARQWLDYLKNELGVDPEEVKLEELMLAKALGDESAGVELARAQLDSEDEARRLCGADALVLAHAPEAEPICRAISHLCRQQWDELREALQAVGRKSPFAHWRLFLRGCAAYYQNDAPLAESCFSKLPVGTIPAQKAEAFGGWRGKDARSLPESVLKETCHLIGESKMAAAIVKSDASWRKRQYLKAYEAMKHSGAKFPDLRVNLSGQITRFFQRADVSLNRADRARWLEFAAKAVGNRRLNTKADDYVLTNTLIHGPDYESDVIWEIYRKSREATRGKSARFHALCHLARADLDLILDCECEDCVEFANDKAISKLKLAIAADPSYEPAYAKLLDSYQTLGKKSAKNKLLDEMSKRFPESKTTLLTAGRACLDRKAYAKGLNYLEKAREASPLDNEVAAEIRRGLMGKSIGHYSKDSPPQLIKARETFELLMKNLPSNPGFAESREFMFLRWSVLEELAVGGRASLQNEKRAKAEGIDAHVAEFFMALYRGNYTMALYGWGDYNKPRVKLRGKKTPSRALQILQILLDNSKLEKGSVQIRSWVSWMEEYINKSLRNLTKNDRSLAIDLYKLLHETDYYWDSYPDRLILRWLKLDMKDPLFIVWHWQVSYESPPQKAIGKVRKEAEKRGDHVALATLATFLKMLDDEDGDDFSSEGLDNIYDNEIEGFYDDDDDSLDSIDVEAMMDQLKPMLSAQRIRFLMSKGVSRDEAESLSLVVDLLNSSDLPDSPRSKPATKKIPSKTKKKPSPVTKPLPDPNQYDLPF